MQKFYFFLVVLFTSVSGFAQTNYKFVDEKSGEDVDGRNGELVKDGYLSYATLHKSGIQNIYSFRTWDSNENYDETSDYFLTLDHRRYLPIWVKVDLQKNDTLVILLTEDENFVSEKIGSHFGICGEPIFIDYTPRPFRSWDKIPEESRKSILLWLHQWIGDKQMEKLYISSGYILNGPDMKQAKVSNAYDEMVYRICLSFSEPAKGIDQYSAYFNFSQTGKLLNEPAFPSKELGDSDDSYDFVSLKEIQAIAFKDGHFDDKETTSTFDFYQRQNTFIWQFNTVMKTSNRGEVKEKSVKYDALTGELLAIFYDKYTPLH